MKTFLLILALPVCYKMENNEYKLFAGIASIDDEHNIKKAVKAMMSNNPAETPEKTDEQVQKIPNGCVISDVRTSKSLFKNLSRILKYTWSREFVGKYLKKKKLFQQKRRVSQLSRLGFCNSTTHSQLSRSDHGDFAITLKPGTNVTDVFAEIKFSGTLEYNAKVICDDADKSELLEFSIILEKPVINLTLDVKVLKCDKSKKKSKCHSFRFMNAVFRRLVTSTKRMQNYIFRNFRSVIVTQLKLEFKSIVYLRLNQKEQSILIKLLKLAILPKEGYDIKKLNPLAKSLIEYNLKNNFNKKIKRRLAKYFGNTCFKKKTPSRWKSKKTTASLA